MNFSWPSILELIRLVLPPVFALLGAYIGVSYGLKQIRIQRRLDYVAKQLNEFYSPLLGYQKAIRAKGDLRNRISQAADEAWKEICANAPRPFEGHKERFEPFKKTIEYDNTQLRKELLPLYHQMLDIFRNNYWLAEPETRSWFTELSDFVELWDRWLADSIPPEVIEKLHHTEDRLQPFYGELETRLELLRGELAGRRLSTRKQP